MHQSAKTTKARHTRQPPPRFAKTTKFLVRFRRAWPFLVWFFRHTVGTNKRLAIGIVLCGLLSYGVQVGTILASIRYAKYIHGQIPLSLIPPLSFAIFITLLLSGIFLYFSKRLTNRITAAFTEQCINQLLFSKPHQPLPPPPSALVLRYIRAATRGQKILLTITLHLARLAIFGITAFLINPSVTILILGLALAAVGIQYSVSAQVITNATELEELRSTAIETLNSMAKSSTNGHQSKSILSIAPYLNKEEQHLNVTASMDLVGYLVFASGFACAFGVLLYEYIGHRADLIAIFLYLLVARLILQTFRSIFAALATFAAVYKPSRSLYLLSIGHNPQATVGLLDVSDYSAADFD